MAGTKGDRKRKTDDENSGGPNKKRPEQKYWELRESSIYWKCADMARYRCKVTIPDNALLEGQQTGICLARGWIQNFKDKTNDAKRQISKNRRIAISEFKGNIMLDIREYYTKDEEMLPGKKGISLTTEQFETLVAKLPEIQHALRLHTEEKPASEDEDDKSEAA